MSHENTLSKAYISSSTNAATNSSTNGSVNQSGLVDPKILIIHSSTSSKMTNEAAKEIMGLINPGQPGYNLNDKNTWLVKFDVRTTTQIAKMDPEDLKKLIEDADIVIAEWLFDSSNFKNVITNHPEIAHNKPNKIFIILESDPDLTSKSEINGIKLFSGINSTALGNTDTKNTILYDLKNANEVRLKVYRTTYPQIAAWIDYGMYYAKKGNINYENQFKLVLKNFTMMNGGSWPSLWEPGNYTTLPAEMLYRNGKIFYTLADYFAQYPIDLNKGTVGIVGLDSPLLTGDMAHFENLTNKLTLRGLNVIPVVGSYSGTNGTLPNNIYSAMVKFFIYDPSNPNKIVNTTEYEANRKLFKCRIDSLVSFTTFTLGSGFVNQTAHLFENMDVPVFRAMISTKREEGEWLLSDDGLLWSDTYYQIAIPETQGIIEPIFVAAPAKSIDSTTGVEIISYTPIIEQMDYLAERVSNWVKLRKMANSDKKIALIYYNYPPGKQNIGASYLAVPESIMGILNGLKQQGYNVTNIPGTADLLVKLMIDRGINVANWAPGELEKLANNPHAILWDAEEYETWFKTLDPIAQKQVIEGPAGYIEEMVKLSLNYTKDSDSAYNATLNTINKWMQEMNTLADTYPDKAAQIKVHIKNMGDSLIEIVENVRNNKSTATPWNKFYLAKNAFMALRVSGLTGWGKSPGDIMTVSKNGRKYIVIPGMKFGNVFIGPEPQRGWEADVAKFYHSTILAPPHQYLAWYAWVNTQFKANAQIHLGRHATYEWLPRKQVALADYDYSNICLGNTPSIYIYIVDGVGEGMQSKRRGLAVIIDHLTPTMKTTTLYGGFLELKSLLDTYSTTPASNPLKQETRNAIIQKVKEMNLASDLGISNVNQMTENDIEKVEDYLVILQQTLMPLGLHTFALRWNDTEIALLASAMISSDGGTSNPSLQRLLAMEKGWNFDNLNIYQAEELNNITQEWVLELFTGKKTVSQLTFNIAIQNKLTEAWSYANKINESFSSEMNSLLNALSAGFVTPGTAHDPIRNPEALPTGKNFYATSENLMPTKVAWNLGKKLADMALAQMDILPEKIAAVVWCVETVRDDGTMASFVLRMMGIEPTWTSTGGASNLKATPSGTLLADLNVVRNASGKTNLTSRPRVDPIVTTSGLFRDLFPRLLINMDRSYRVALAASYDQIITQYPGLKQSLDYAVKTLEDAKYTNFKGNESISTNYIAKHWVNDTLKYISQGMNLNDSGEMAITRIFAPSVGDYGAGVNKAVEQSWEVKDRDQLADVYLNRMSHAYSERNWGGSMPGLFKELLKGIDAAYHSRSTNLYGVLDNDDYFDYFGGLSLAIEKMNNGKAPKLNVVYYANNGNPKIIGLKEFMTIEMRTRYFNPEWIQSMINEGYSGARTVSNRFVNHQAGWELTAPHVVEDWMWNEVVDVYINDKYNLGTKEWFNSKNPYALISISGTLLTMAHEGYWKADAATLKLVTNTWANAIAQNGVACCDCSCGNIAMMKWATQYINPDILAQFNAQVYKSTMNPSFAPDPSNSETPKGQINTGQTSSGKQVETASSSGPSSDDNQQQSDAGQSPGDMGVQKAYEVSKSDANSGSSQTGMPIAAIVGVVLLVALIGVGYFRTDIMGWFKK